MVVIGISPELDVIESLEKRVKSRFTHRQIEMFPPATFDEYLEIVQALLTPPNADKVWNKHILDLMAKKPWKQLLMKLFNINNTIANLKQLLALALLETNDLLTTEDLDKVFEEQTGSAETPILTGLTLIEICTLIAIKHIQVIYEGQPFNFEMA